VAGEPPPTLERGRHSGTTPTTVSSHEWAIPNFRHHRARKLREIPCQTLETRQKRL
jgi:hypothetical protein